MKKKINLLRILPLFLVSFSYSQSGPDIFGCAFNDKNEFSILGYSCDKNSTQYSDVSWYLPSSNILSRPKKSLQLD